MGPGFESPEVHQSRRDPATTKRSDPFFNNRAKRRVELDAEVSVINAVGPPVPIPNTEVKRCSGENTWLATARENSSTLTQENKPDESSGVGYFNAVGPPVPIPNTEVKRCSGKDTWLATARKNSS